MRIVCVVESVTGAPLRGGADHFRRFGQHPPAASCSRRLGEAFLGVIRKPPIARGHKTSFPAPFPPHTHTSYPQVLCARPTPAGTYGRDTPPFTPWRVSRAAPTALANEKKERKKRRGKRRRRRERRRLSQVVSQKACGMVTVDGFFTQLALEGLRANTQGVSTRKRRLRGPR